MGLQNPNDFQHHPDLVEACLRPENRPGAQAAYTELCEQLHQAPGGPAAAASAVRPLPAWKASSLVQRRPAISTDSGMGVGV